MHPCCPEGRFHLASCEQHRPPEDVVKRGLRLARLAGERSAQPVARRTGPNPVARERPAWRPSRPGRCGLPPWRPCVGRGRTAAVRWRSYLISESQCVSTSCPWGSASCHRRPGACFPGGCVCRFALAPSPAVPAAHRTFASATGSRGCSKDTRPCADAGDSACAGQPLAPHTQPCLSSCRRIGTRPAPTEVSPFWVSPAETAPY